MGASWEDWATGEDGRSESVVRSGDSRHVDMRVAVIHEIMDGHIYLFGFLMVFSSLDEEVSSDFHFFFGLLSFFLLLLLPRVGFEVDFFKAIILRQKIRL